MPVSAAASVTADATKRIRANSVSCGASASEQRSINDSPTATAKGRMSEERDDQKQQRSQWRRSFGLELKRSRSSPMVKHVEGSARGEQKGTGKTKEEKNRRRASPAPELSLSFSSANSMTTTSPPSVPEPPYHQTKLRSSPNSDEERTKADELGTVAVKDASAGSKARDDEGAGANVRVQSASSSSSATSFQTSSLEDSALSTSIRCV